MKNTKIKILSAAMAALIGTAAFAPYASAESLFSSRPMSRSIFADRKACQPGDILTIVISETSSTTTTKAYNNSKDGNTSLSAGIGIFDFLKAASASQSDSMQANGGASDVNNVTGRVTVTVADVLPNGNMILEGTQSIWQNRDEHKITFHGVCRMDDVEADNTIPSSKIAEANVRFDGKGPLNAKQRQGIITQILNFLF